MNFISEFWFDTEAEAEAFRQGVEWVNDSDVEVKGIYRCKETDSFCVSVTQWKETE